MADDDRPIIPEKFVSQGVVVVSIRVKDESDRSAVELGDGCFDLFVERAELAVNEQNPIRTGGNSDVTAFTVEQINALGDSLGLDLNFTEILGAGPACQAKTGQKGEDEAISL
jgi:hypothetical protein